MAKNDLKLIKKDGTSISVDIKPPRSCKHENVSVDERTLEVTCIRCDSPVNPAMFILNWARMKIGRDYTAEKIDESRRETINKVKRQNNLGHNKGYKALWELSEIHVASLNSLLEYVVSELSEMGSKEMAEEIKKEIHAIKTNCLVGDGEE